MEIDQPELPADDLESHRADFDEFYKQGSISNYFNTRLAVLAAVNEHSKQFVTWANEGINFHGLRITIPSVGSDDGLPDSRSANSDPLQWYIQTETISLQHHALETLLRLYTGLIHAGHWLDPLKAVTDRDRNLVELVEQHITRKLTNAMRGDVSYLLLGDPELRDDADWLAVVDNLSGILQVLARQWLDGRRTYNAIKHGLLISQGDKSLRAGLTGGDMRTISDGPSITCLNHTNWGSRTPPEHPQGAKTRDWSVDTRWISFEQAGLFITVACVLIDCLWSLAVARWSRAGAEEVTVANLDPAKINPMMLEEAGPSTQRMSWHMFTEIKRD